MAKITTVSTTRELIFPGLAQSVMLKVTNDGSQTIQGFKVLAEAYKAELGTGTGTVELGYIVGSDDEFGGASIRAGGSADVPAYFTLPSALTEEFADSVRTAPIHLRITVRYSGGSLFTQQQVLENALLMNHRYGPLIEDFELERSEDGVLNDEGLELMANLKLRTQDNKTTFMKLMLYWAENVPVTEQSSNVRDLTANIPALLTGVTNNRTLVPGEFSNGSNWNFLLVFGDEYEKRSLYIDVSRAFANVHLSGEPTGGVCFGGFCKKTTDEEGNPQPKFECHYPAYFYGGIALGGAGDYSLEEQDTGSKWIDGRTIYKKTVMIPSVSSGSDATNIASLGTGGISTLLHYEGALTRNDGNLVYPLGFDTAGGTAYKADFYINKSSDTLTVRTNSSTAISGGHVTIYYTKSTDAATTEVT